MKRIQVRQYSNNRGFSLIELIIVIAVLAILAMLLVPQFLKYVEKSRKYSDLDTVDEVVNAVHTAYTDSDYESIDFRGQEIILYPASNPDISAGLQAPLEEFGVDQGRLKSTKWGTGIKIAVSADGVCEVSSVGDGEYDANEEYK